MTNTIVNARGYFNTFITAVKSFFGGQSETIEDQLTTYKTNVTKKLTESNSYHLAIYLDQPGGNNILQLACRHNCLDVVKRIVEHPMFYNYDIADYISLNADATATSTSTASTSTTTTPIRIAMMLEHTEIYQYLQQRLDRHNHIHIVDLLNRITDYNDKQKFIKYIMSDSYKFNKFERTIMDISSVNHDYVQNLSKFHYNPYSAMQFMPQQTTSNPE